jgi:hypothetical protein
MFRQSLLCLLIGLCTAASAQSNTGHQQAIDGNWWRASDKAQREGFLAGYVDCSTAEAKNKVFEVQWNNYEPKITEFYNAHPTELKKPVAEVFLQVIGQYPQNPKALATGEKYTGKHGMFDGEYWRQVPDQREGFVQGLLVCYQGLKTKRATFSKPAAWYASEISKWYGVREDDPSEINEKRVSVAIADVLLKFRDATPKNAHHHRTHLLLATPFPNSAFGIPGSHPGKCGGSATVTVRVLRVSEAASRA